MKDNTKNTEQHQENDSAEQDFATRQIVVFKVGKEEYAAPIDAIKEVVLTPEIISVPLMPGYLRGVANVRGNVLAMIDLAKRFKVTESTLSEPLHDAEALVKSSYTLVIESEEVHMGILVSEVPNTLIVKESMIDESPSVMSKDSFERSYIKGVIKLEDRLVILIDVFNVINEEELREDYSLK